MLVGGVWSAVQWFFVSAGCRVVVQSGCGALWLVCDEWAMAFHMQRCV